MFKTFLEKINIIRVVAMTTMVIDHIGVYLFPNLIILRTIGRISMPLFVILLVYGLKKTKNSKQYSIRLLITAIITELMLFLLGVSSLNKGYINLNFMFSLALMAATHREHYKYSLMLFLVTIFTGQSLIDYGIYGYLMFEMIYEMDKKGFRNCQREMWTIVAVSIIRFAGSGYIGIRQLVAVPVFLLSPQINAYLDKRKRVKRNSNWNKIFNYLFYPVHLLILILIRGV